MSEGCTIRTHTITLADGGLVLRPLSDADLPLLYRWNADLEVLYWSDEADLAEPYSEEKVRYIYGSVSQNALCFLIELDGTPIGECWLQRMDLADVRARYPEGADVRRIDMMIGEKAYWGRGLGTRFIGLLTALAFECEGADAVYGVLDDYNIRSRRVFEKNGYVREDAVELPASKKARFQYRYRLTRAEYEARRG